jgi:DNA-binding NtrC family response regulator
LASELFGHVRGSFTGAHRDKAGKLELADGGTLFLDEVESMSPRLQVMLLRVLEHGEVQKVGEERNSRRVDVRVIAASNQDLGSLVDEGTFREDLYYRLNVFDIRVPPLRERTEDIPLLADHFLRSFRRENGGGPESISGEALERMAAYPWPGNVRELRNSVHRAAVLAFGREIRLADLPREIRDCCAQDPADDSSVVAVDPGAAGDDAVAPATTAPEESWNLDAQIERHLLRVLAAVDGNKTRAAELLGIPRTSLYHKLRKYGIEED